METISSRHPYWKKNRNISVNSLEIPWIDRYAYSKHKNNAVILGINALFLIRLLNIAIERTSL